MKEKILALVREMLTDCDIVDDLTPEDKTVYTAYLRHYLNQMLEVLNEG